MRKIRGWIKTLANASGPPSGTVDVYAEDNDDDEIGLETHGLGYLDRTHQTGGAGSINLADAGGHFGWDMEFSPGPITTRITARDPLPAQYRMRLPDESAQVGKAFHSDLERLGWTAGRDCLVWGAIEGVAPPDAASWSSDPLVSSGQGDWSVDLSSAATNPGRVTLRRGIGFLGGVTFSIEAGDLLVPVVGEDAAPANGGTEDRWDLLVAWMDVADPASATYGKQGISIQRGTAGEGIPPLDARTGYRQMVLHALKMAAGGGVYTEAFDLRPWSPVGMPPFTSAEPLAKSYGAEAGQPIAIGSSFVPSLLNTPMNSNEFILSPTTRYHGQMTWSGSAIFGAAGVWYLYVAAHSEARDAAGTLIPATDYVLHPAPGHYRIRIPAHATLNNPAATVSLTWPIQVIPAYASGGGSSRPWTRLRFQIMLLGGGNSGMHMSDQYCTVQLWPLP